LQSVYSEQHARSIPNLGFLEFLAFGKAIRAERPILLKRKFDQGIKDAIEKLRQPLSTADTISSQTATDDSRSVDDLPQEIVVGYVQCEADLAPEEDESNSSKR